MTRLLALAILWLSICVSQSALAQSYQFQGSWTKLNTTYVFDFELVLNKTGNNQVNGTFFWQLVNYDEGSALSKSHYENKIGLTAREYVRGSYHPGKKSVFFRGIQKR